MSDTSRTALPVGFGFQGYEITGAPADDGHALHYPALRRRDERAVTIAEFLPRGLAQRTGGYVEPAFDLEDLYDQERDRFERDAGALARIDHADVLATWELFRHEGTSYRVQAIAGGRSLGAVMEGGGPLSQRELYQILDPVLDGLEAIHAAGTWHHAISPAAVRLHSDGAILWTGMAAPRIACARALAAATGGPMPTANAFQAPELQLSETPGTAADYYGFAALLYRLATGQPPQPAAERQADDRALPSSEHAGDRYNELFLGAVDAGLALDPAARPADMATWRPMFRRERRKVL